MGSRTLISCDWCGIEEDEDASAAAHWNDYDGAMLCELCISARQRGLAFAEEMQRSLQERHLRAKEALRMSGERKAGKPFDDGSEDCPDCVAGRPHTGGRV